MSAGSATARRALHVAMAGGLLLVALAGCQSEPPRGHTDRFYTMVVSLHNTGGTAKDVDLTVTGPDGKVLLHKELQAPPGYHNETVDAAQVGTYTILADYTQTSTRGTATQTITGSQRHTLKSDDCQLGRVVVLFTFSYTSTSQSQSWNSGGSKGICVQ